MEERGGGMWLTEVADGGGAEASGAVLVWGCVGPPVLSPSLERGGAGHAPMPQQQLCSVHSAHVAQSAVVRRSLAHTSHDVLASMMRT